jgi:hypothetical protein
VKDKAKKGTAEAPLVVKTKLIGEREERKPNRRKRERRGDPIGEISIYIY